MNLKIVLILALLVQTVAAFDYTDLPELNLTIGIPPYETVWKYNIALSNSVSGPPEGIDIINDVPFEDAWIKILAVDKSIADNGGGLTMAAREGNVLIKYEYEPTCPSSNYDWGDCQGKRYQLVDWNEDLKIYANNDYEGNDPIEDYSIANSDDKLDILAELRLEVECKKYKLRDYEINDTWYCEEKYMGRRYYGDIVEDTITYLVPTLTPQANLSFSKISENELDISKGRLIVTILAPVSELDFRLGEKRLVFSRNAYDIQAYLPDYNLLQISTYSLPRIIESDMFSTIHETRNNDTGEIIINVDFTLTFEETRDVLDSRNCEVILKDLFENEYRIDNLCGVDWKQTRINASTNNKIYAHGEEMILEAVLLHNNDFLPGRSLTAVYGGGEHTEITDNSGKATFTINAEYPRNRLDIEFQGDGEYLQSSKTLLVAITSSKLNAIIIQILPPLLILIISGYGIYKMIKLKGGYTG